MPAGGGFELKCRSPYLSASELIAAAPVEERQLIDRVNRRGVDVHALVLAASGDNAALLLRNGGMEGQRGGGIAGRSCSRHDDFLVASGTPIVLQPRCSADEDFIAFRQRFAELGNS